MRHDVRGAQDQHPGVEFLHRALWGLRSAAGVGIEWANVPGSFGRGCALWPPDRRSSRTARIPAAPSFPHQAASSVVMIGEEQERLRLAPFLAHEQQGDLRAEQQQQGVAAARAAGSANVVSRSPKARLPIWS